jgi:type II secretory pathway component PulJ
MEEVCLEERCIRELNWTITQVATSTMADMRRELTRLVPVVTKPEETVPEKSSLLITHKQEKPALDVKKGYDCINTRIEKMSHLLKSGTLHQVDAVFLRATIKRETVLQEEYRLGLTHLRTEVIGMMKSKQQMLAVFVGMADENTSIPECTDVDQLVITRLQEEIKTHQQYLKTLQVTNK